MKIVHLLGWYFPDSVGGTEIYVAGLCRRLRDAGHDVVVAAPQADATGEREYAHDGTRVFRYGIASEPTRDEALQRVPARGARAFHEWLARESPDLLHVHSFTTGVGLHEIRAAHRLGIRVIATCHLPGLGYMCRTGELMQWGRYPCDGIVEPAKCGSCNLTRLGMPRPIALASGAVPVAIGRVLGGLPGRLGTSLGMSASVADYSAMQRELFGLIDRFVVLNDTARRMLESNGSPAAKLVVNRLGISHQGLERKAPPDRRPTAKPVTFGYAGRLHPTKGLLQLVHAVRAVPSHVTFTMEIRGPQSDTGAGAFVDALRAAAGDDPRIRFFPGVPPSEVPRVLAGLDVLVCPSTWFENGPTVALEAYAVGTPIIASAVGNLNELVRDGVNGRLVTPGETRAWAAAIEEAAQHPERTVDAWRAHIDPPRTMDDIARDYLTLYAA